MGYFGWRKLVVSDVMCHIISICRYMYTFLWVSAQTIASRHLDNRHTAVIYIPYLHFCQWLVMQCVIICIVCTFFNSCRSFAFYHKIIDQLFIKIWLRYALLHLDCKSCSIWNACVWSLMRFCFIVPNIHVLPYATQILRKLIKRWVSYTANLDCLRQEKYFTTKVLLSFFSS